MHSVSACGDAPVRLSERTRPRICQPHIWLPLGITNPPQQKATAKQKKNAIFHVLPPLRAIKICPLILFARTVWKQNSPEHVSP